MSNNRAVQKQIEQLPVIAFWFLVFLPAAFAAGGSSHEAGDSEYLARVWQTEDGLPQNSITAITQTRDGYLWLGTFNGLVRFDGVRFTTFTTANTPGLISDSIVTLCEDRAGRLWIGTDGGGLARHHNGVFASYTVASNRAALVVSGLAEGSRGRLWVGTDGGLFRVVDERLELVSPATSGGVGIVHSMCSDLQGQVWICARNGLFNVADAALKPVPGYPGGVRVTPDIESGVWVSGSTNGLTRLQPGRVAHNPQWSGEGHQCMLQTARGDVWLGNSKGLSRLRDGNRKDYPVPGKLLSHEVIALFEDREGNLWLGTNGGGLRRLRERLVENLTTQEGLPGNDVVVLQEDTRGRIWIGGFGMGIGVWEGGGYQPIAEVAGRTQDIIALWQGRDSSMWISGRGQRLVCWKDGRLASFDPPHAEAPRIVFEDRDGGLWLGFRLEGVVNRRDGKTIRYSSAEGLSNDNVTGIIQDKQGDIWIGTKRGINRVHDGKTTSFFREHGLGSDCIHTLHVDRQGVLWVGTVGGGVSRFKDGHFSTVSGRQGLPNEVIAQIVEDDLGYFYFGSNGGIIRSSREDLIECIDGRQPALHCRLFNRSDGMLNPECAGSFQPSCLKARDGKLWFATVGGVVIIDPGRLVANALRPPVRVEEVKAEGEACPMEAETDDSPAKARIPPGKGHVQIAYAGLSYVAPESVRFRFRLEGLDEKWVEAGSRRTAYFNRLRPGQYLFRVKACNNQGVWNEAGASLALVVEPFWWQTLWFQAGLVLGVGGAAVSLAHAAHRHRLRRAVELAEQRNARLRAEEVGAANVQLQARTKELEEALANVRTLHGLIPICAHCKKIRDDRGFWEQVEGYVQRHSHAKFSHGICPSCMQEHYQDILGNDMESS